MKTKQATTAALFGGALFAAGMVATPAQADWNVVSHPVNNADIRVEDNFGNLYTYNYGGFDDNAVPVSNSYSWNWSYSSGSVLTAITSTSIIADLVIAPGASGFFDSGGFNARSSALALVTVGEPTDVLIEWQFASSAIAPEVSVFNITAGDFDFLADENSTSSGSQLLTLMPGNEYGITNNTGHGISELGHYYASTTIIPAPGALALLGMAGLGTTRRRRRN